MLTVKVPLRSPERDINQKVMTEFGLNIQEGDDLESTNLIEEQRPLLFKKKYLRHQNIYLKKLSNFLKPSKNESSVPKVEHHPIRQPFDYESTRSNHSNSHVQAMLHRYKYYSKLSSPKDDILKIPDHVLPNYLFVITEPPKSQQSSLVTIFSIWNTMVGTSLLSFPWAIGHAGLVTGIFLIIAMCAVTCYTCYLVLWSSDKMMKEQPGIVIEFSDVCKKYLGRVGELSSIIFSLITLIGAIVIFWVLMTNFLYTVINYIYYSTNNLNVSNDCTTEVCCSRVHLNCQDYSTNQHSLHSYPLLDLSNTTDTFNNVWNMQNTVPLFLLILIVPLVNLKSPTFFTKFNALGTLSVCYILIFVIVKASRSNIHMKIVDDICEEDIYFRNKFPILTGTLSLSYFIHSCIMSITRNQSRPENNFRDLIVAYIVVMLTYLGIAVIFYITFPLNKYCLEDNFLKNFNEADVMSLIARCSLLFQMMTVFPLICYIIRVQLLHTIFGSIYPSFLHIFILNFFLLVTCVLIAVFYPHVGDILRYVGAFAGCAYVFTLPCLVYLVQHWHNISIPMIVFHSIIIILGILNLIAQFIVKPD